MPDRVAGRVRARGFTKAYVHLDLDVFDPREFRDVLVPVARRCRHECRWLTRFNTWPVRSTSSDSVWWNYARDRADAVRKVHGLVEKLGVKIGIP